MKTLTFTTSFIVGLSMVSACAAKPSAPQSHVEKKPSGFSSYIKPGAGIGYSHDLTSQYSVGDAVTFQLNLGESYSAGIMRVDITSNSLQLLTSGNSLAFDMSTGEEHEVTVSFNALSNGRHYINVRALADIGDGNPMSRAFSIPVQVGPVVAQKPNENMKTLETGEQLIEMEAQEEIK